MLPPKNKQKPPYYILVLLQGYYKKILNFNNLPSNHSSFILKIKLLFFLINSLLFQTIKEKQIMESSIRSILHRHGSENIYA